MDSFSCVGVIDGEPKVFTTKSGENFARAIITWKESPTKLISVPCTFFRRKYEILVECSKQFINNSLNGTTIFIEGHLGCDYFYDEEKNIYYPKIQIQVDNFELLGSSNPNYKGGILCFENAEIRRKQSLTEALENYEGDI